MLTSRHGQPSPNIHHLGKAERSSGFTYRTGAIVPIVNGLSFTYKDADDPQPSASSDHRRETRGAHSRGRRARGRTLRGGADTHGLLRGRSGYSRRHIGQVRERQARFGRRRPPRRGRGRRRQERHDDGRHRAGPDRAGRGPAGRGEGRLRGPYLRQARLRPRHRPDRQGRRGHQGGLQALLRARHRPAPGDRAGRPDAVRRHRQGRQARPRRPAPTRRPARTPPPRTRTTRPSRRVPSTS